MLTYLAALAFPNIDAVAFEIGPFTVKWYGLAYMAGLLLGWWYVKYLIRDTRLWRDGKAALTSDQSDDLLLWVTLAVIIGGRLGQVLLYDPDYYFHNPAEIIKTWKGGMSFHGALIASGLALLVFARNMKVSALSVMDLCCASVPAGLFLGRVANFINSELKPNMIRSMCCRLQLDLRELLKRGNEMWTRMMGYHRPVSEFNPGKKSEHRERLHFVECQTLAK